MHIKTQHLYTNTCIQTYTHINTLTTHHINLLIKTHTHIIKSNTYTYKNKNTHIPQILIERERGDSWPWEEESRHGGGARAEAVGNAGEEGE